MILSFGKHKGKPLTDVPADYLRWLLAKCHTAGEDLKRAVRLELNCRDDPGSARRGAYRDLLSRELPDGLTADDLEIEMIRLLCRAEQEGDFGRGEALDALWHGVALAFNLLRMQPRRSEPRSLGELIALARRLETN